MAQGGGNRDSANHSRESSFDEEDKTGKLQYQFVCVSIFVSSVTSFAEGADTPDSPMNEFVSDSYQSQTLSKDLKEVQEGIKRLGSKKKPNGTRGRKICVNCTELISLIDR